MNMEKYRLDAYRAHSSPETNAEKTAKKTENRGVHNNAASGAQNNVAHNNSAHNAPFIHKPVFERINPAELSAAERKKKDEETLENARLAAQSGTWFEKKNVTHEDVTQRVDTLISQGLLKVPAENIPQKNESIYRRVAKFLVIIGMDEAAKILPHLSQEQTERIIPEIARISYINEDEKNEILEEFSALLDKAREDGGVETARDILVKAYGKEKGEELLRKSVQFPDGKPFDFLEEASAERIKILLTGESVAVKTLVLSQLEPKKAAQVINTMEMQEKKDVILRLSKMQRVTPDVLENTAKSLKEKLLTQNTESSDRIDGKNILAEILRRMNPEYEDTIIKSLSENDPELGSDIREKLFTSEDIVNCDDKYLQKVLYPMDEKDLAVLIHKKDEAFREKILSNVSKSRRELILSEENLTHEFYKSDMERITGSFFSTLRRAWERGDLRIKGRDDDEVYV